MTADGPGGDEPSEAGGDPSDRVDRLLERARDERDGFDPPADPDERALEYLREGLWPTIETYIRARTGELRRFDRDEWERLEAALREWLRLYALCYGERLDPDVTIRTAAEAFVDTHDLRDTARILTGVPERSDRT